MTRARSSRQRYETFRTDYRRGTLDAATERESESPPASPRGSARTRRREYLRDYLRWLWPQRYAIAAIFALALLAAGLEMIEPLFMRFITDRVLLVDTLN